MPNFKQSKAPPKLMLSNGKSLKWNFSGKGVLFVSRGRCHGGELQVAALAQITGGA